MPGARCPTEVEGNRAEVRVLQEGLTAATGGTVVGTTVLVPVERAKAVAVPYRMAGSDKVGTIRMLE